MSDLLEFLRIHDETFRSRNRLQSLYSDFRLQKTSNPDGYDANCLAWLRALTAAARAGRLPATTTSTSKATGQPSHVVLSSGEELARALNSPQWGRPLALDAVIQEAMEKRELVALDQFLTSTKSVYAKSWVPSPWQVMSWGLKQIGVASLFASGDKLAVGNFVVMANLEEAASTIISKAANMDQSLTSRIFSRTLFESEFAHALDDATTLSTTDFDILLRHLCRDKPALSLSSNAQTIKLALPGQSPEPVTQQDEDIANLRTLITALDSQVSALTLRISTLDTSARQAVSAKRTLQAKSALRSKKLAETTLQARSDTLSQLEETYTAIQTAADQVAIVQAMSASSRVLESLHNEIGGAEGVETVVEKLRDEMDMVEEVGRVINEGTGARTEQGDVEDEFEAMEKEEREKREKIEREEREKREKTEREERERKEAEEAQRTAERFRELEQVEAERKAKDVERGREQEKKDDQGDLAMENV